MKTNIINPAAMKDHYSEKTTTAINELSEDIKTLVTHSNEIPKKAQDILDKVLSGDVESSKSIFKDVSKLKEMQITLIVDELALLQRKENLKDLVKVDNLAEAERLSKLVIKRRALVEKSLLPLTLPDLKRAALINTDSEVVKIGRGVIELRSQVHVITVANLERRLELRAKATAALAV